MGGNRRPGNTECSFPTADFRSSPSTLMRPVTMPTSHTKEQPSTQRQTPTTKETLTVVSKEALTPPSKVTLTRSAKQLLQHSAKQLLQCSEQLLQSPTVTTGIDLICRSSETRKFL